MAAGLPLMKIVLLPLVLTAGMTVRDTAIQKGWFIFGLEGLH